MQEKYKMIIGFAKEVCYLNGLSKYTNENNKCNIASITIDCFNVEDGVEKVVMQIKDKEDKIVKYKPKSWEDLEDIFQGVISKYIFLKKIFEDMMKDCKYFYKNSPSLFRVKDKVKKTDRKVLNDVFQGNESYSKDYIYL
ncbi:MAG: hypothetical protein PVI75_03915 [Gammaproteobacteria bacterium]